MKAYFIILLIAVHMATATLTIDKITEKVHAGLKTLKEKAVTKLHNLKKEFDVKKLHQLDVLHLLPYAHKHFVHEHYSKKTPLLPQHQVEKLKHYFEPQHKHHIHIEPLHKPHIHIEPHHKPHLHIEPIKPLPLHYHHFEHFEHHL